MNYESSYTENQILADIAFVEYCIKKYRVKLIQGTGLQKLIDDCKAELDVVRNGRQQQGALPVLYSLVDSLKNLWMCDVDFTIQIGAMNSGQYQYGDPDPDKQQFFKDFEYEIFSASHLIKNGINVELPQDTSGEDIVFEDIDIQCKHPKTCENIDGYLRSFNGRLNKTGRYGVFGLAIEDCLGYNQRQPMTVDAYKMYIQQKMEENDAILKGIFEPILPTQTRILGIYTTTTYLACIQGYGLRLFRSSNSFILFRPLKKEIKDRYYKQAYRIIHAFNDHPAWLTLN